MGQVIERLEPSVPKVCRHLEDAEEDLLAFYAFPQAHWPKLRSTDEIVKGVSSLHTSRGSARLAEGVVDPERSAGFGALALPRSLSRMVT